MSATRTTPVVEKATDVQKGKRTKKMEDTTEPESELTPPVPLRPSGYDANVVLFASRDKQGGRTVYSLNMSPEQIVNTITKPDPEKVALGNRAIRPAHARGFARYIRERKDWVSPSIMLRTPSPFGFEVQEEVAGIQFGLITIPRRSLMDLHIIDGQHRILGMFWAIDQIAADLDKARSNLALARRNEGKGGVAEKEARARIADLEVQRERLGTERVGVQIHVENNPTAYNQMFSDVNSFALGVTASVKSRYDTTKVVHRALAPTMEHPLLLGRVDPEGDRLGRGSQFMFGAKHVAEIIRTVTVGLDGRVSRRQEAELNEQDLAKTAKDFFTMLTEAFPQEQAISLGQLLPSRLRETSLLGSVLFVRILAGVYYDLINLHAFERNDVKAFFEKLAPHVSGPVYDGSIWTTNVNDGIFSAGGMAPRGRRQDLKFLKNAISGWALDKPKFLDEPPAPRPEEIVEEVSTEEEMRVVDEILARKG